MAKGNINPKQVFYFFFVLYVALGLLNLGILPIAWTDEVMNLDPALQWHKHGTYSGFLWPNKGSDDLFLSYPPLIQWVHIAFLYIVPFDIFWTRFTFLIIHCFSIVLLWHLLNQRLKNATWTALFFTMLFMFDTVVFEISRSMRVEVLEVFLLLCFIYTADRKWHPLVQAIPLGLLLTAHLSMWPLAGLWLLHSWLQKPERRHTTILAIASVIPWLVFLAWTGFRFTELYNQLFIQSEKHMALGGFTERILAFFYGRFRYVYTEQPWVPLLHALMFIHALVAVILSKGKNKTAFVFIGTSLFWMFVLAPHYRYWPPLYVLGLLMLAENELLKSVTNQWENKRVFRWILFLFIPFLTAGFFARHALSRYQAQERDLSRVHNWLKAQIPAEKTLVIGDAAAFYLCNNDSLDYGMDMYPQNLHPEKYRHVFLLTRDSVSSLKPFSVSGILKTELPDWAGNIFKASQTYAGLTLYRIENTRQWDMITEKYKDDYR